jgi:hypothetical protein
MTDKLIVTLLMGINWLSFFVVKEALLEENEDLLEKEKYFEKTKSWV